jgi:hypothetical protein
LLTVVGAGCGRGGFERFVPAEETARNALEKSLTAWQKGQAPGTVETGPPAIELVDSHRRPGQRLQGFAILGTAPGEGPRCYAVRLHLENPTEEKKVRFVVLGLDPLWVLRYEDYEMMAHWEHPMENPKKTESRQETKK